MTQPVLDLTPLTLTERVRRVFLDRPLTWIDGHAFQQVGGFAGWSARIRDLRKQPHAMTILNRTKRSSGYTVTEYLYLPDVRPDEVSDDLRARVRQL